MMPGTLTDLALALVLGAGLGVGVWCLLALAPRWGAPTLARRIGPYVRDIGDPLGATPLAPPVDPGAAIVTGVRGLWTAAQHRLDALLGGSETIARRLTQAGWTSATDAGSARAAVAAFRGRQLAWAIAGLAAGAAIIVALVVAGRMTPAAAVLPIVLAAVGAVLCDARLSAASRARVVRVDDELPTVLEFLALCLAAGEGLLDSLRRVGEVGSGELTAEVRAAVLAVGTGSPLSEALGALSGRLQVPALTRSIDHLVAAIERGAPLAQVLQAQANDAREDAKRRLIEQAGKKEIAMLVPLVFLILPLSVVFAVFPGVFMLRLGLG